MAAEGGCSSREGKEPEAKVTYYQLKEVAKRNSDKDMWIVIQGEHPGGEEVLMEQAGWDGNLGHSSDAKEMLKQYYPGEVHPSDRKGEESENSSSFCKSCWSSWIIPIVGAVLLAVMYRFYMVESKLS
ncbi:cytochrome b5 type B-like [Notamacropus eugenii]|uniref:cytochrome b5 type B-like n=1 Tax=Notamacropus eugenii TaxID=9315 RepID=UPI003B67CAE7